jgi:hypothetical protein
MSIGLVMGGCIAAGYLIGTWLDNRFGTAFWVPVCVFLGMAAGFREMFRTLKRISALTKWPGASASSRDTNGQEQSATGAETHRAAGPGGTAAPVQPTARKRLFEVPEPPLASFEQDKNRSAHSVSTTAQPPRANDAGSGDVLQDEAGSSDTLRELMGAEKYAEFQAELKALRENDTDEETGNTSSGDDRKQPQ